VLFVTDHAFVILRAFVRRSIVGREPRFEVVGVAKAVSIESRIYHMRLMYVTSSLVYDIHNWLQSHNSG
jgi:hypothetical protein